LATHWERFSEQLLATGDQPIVEESRRDDFWGAKRNANGQLVGANVLGQLLVELREERKGPIADGLRVVEPLDIPEFLLYGEPIRSVQPAKM